LKKKKWTKIAEDGAFKFNYYYILTIYLNNMRYEVLAICLGEGISALFAWNYRVDNPGVGSEILPQDNSNTQPKLFVGLIYWRKSFKKIIQYSLNTILSLTT
jgi:hypothetical protein